MWSNTKKSIRNCIVRADKSKGNKITLDIELQDLLNVVSRGSSAGPIGEPMSAHDVEGEALKKAWFRHMLLSMEKISDTVEDIRRVDLHNLRTEFKEELLRVDAKAEKIETNIKTELNRIDNKAEKSEDELKLYKKEIIDPVINKVITIWVKLGMLSLIAGCVGGGIIGLIFVVLKDHFIKPAVHGGP